MDTLALIAVLAGIAFVFTRLFCRRPVAKSRPPSILLAVAGAFCTSLVMIFIISGRDLFTRKFWDDGKAPAVMVVPIFFGIFFVVSLIPALLVIRYHRKKIKSEPHRLNVFTRDRNWRLVIRCANLAIASFFLLIAILPPNWGRGPWSGPPIEFQVTIRSVLLNTLAYAWFASAVFWFIRSSFEWLCCFVSVLAFAISCAVIVIGFFR